MIHLPFSTACMSSDGNMRNDFDQARAEQTSDTRTKRGRYAGRLVLSLGLAAVALPILAPKPAHAGWHGGVWVGEPVYVVPPAAYVPPPPPGPYYVPPSVVYVPPAAHWVPGHYNWRGFWIPGHYNW